MQALLYCSSSIDKKLLVKYNFRKLREDSVEVPTLAELLNTPIELKYAFLPYKEYSSNKDIVAQLRNQGVRCFVIFNNVSEYVTAFNQIKPEKPYQFTIEDGTDAYDITTKGDSRFSPFFMHYKGVSIETYYQLIIKRYGLFGYSNWDQVKGKPPVELIPVSEPWTRSSVRKDSKYLYLFTDNLTRSSGRIKGSAANPKNAVDKESSYARTFMPGKVLLYPSMTQAVIRGLDNACPITTMKDSHRTQLDNLAEAKEAWEKEINYIITKFRTGKYKGIKFSSAQFGNGSYSKFSQDFLDVINEQLLRIGIDNTPNGAYPTKVETLEEVYFNYFQEYPELLFELANIGLTKKFYDRFYVSSNSQSEIYANLLNKLFKL